MATTTYKKSTAREYTESIIIAVILALFIRTWVVQAFKIPTGSMENNLLVGDHLLVDKFAFSPTLSDFERTFLPISHIKRGDVIVFKYPVEPDRDFIKRVIGLPGDRLELHRKRVYINGEPLEDPWAQHLTPPSVDGPPQLGNKSEEYGPVTVPTDQYFMMGDNRDNSEDSRYWGFMPKSYVKGKALFIYFSIAEGQPLSSLFTSARWSRILNRVR